MSILYLQKGFENYFAIYSSRALLSWELGYPPIQLSVSLLFLVQSCYGDPLVLRLEYCHMRFSPSSGPCSCACCHECALLCIDDLPSQPQGHFLENPLKEVQILHRNRLRFCTSFKVFNYLSSSDLYSILSLSNKSDASIICEFINFSEYGQSLFYSLVIFNFFMVK